jgi:hypothetical protein
MNDNTPQGFICYCLLNPCTGLFMCVPDMKLIIFIKVRSENSRCSGWLQAAPKRGRNSSPNRVKNFLVSKSSRPAIRFNQLPIQLVPEGCFLGGKAAWVRSSPHIFNHWRGQENLDPYIHFSICLYSTVLN